MKGIFKILLLLGLPASGKSEIRRFLASVDKETLARDFHIGEIIHMDDFPYVHFMRKIDLVLEKNNIRRVFFDSDELPFKNPYDWGTLVYLLNEDYLNLVHKTSLCFHSYTEELFRRIDNAARKVDIRNRLAVLEPDIFRMIKSELEFDAKEIFENNKRLSSENLEGKTVIIEFARGGGEDSMLPLEAPFGYGYSLAQLSNEILKNSVILYNWVTPEESRRRNKERFDPNKPGSILYHGVPAEVMQREYGIDDMEWLRDNSNIDDTIMITKGSRIFYIPVAFFDNRVDKTTFLRQEKNLWDENKIEVVSRLLKVAFQKLFLKTIKN